MGHFFGPFAEALKNWYSFCGVGVSRLVAATHRKALRKRGQYPYINDPQKTENNNRGDDI